MKILILNHRGDITTGGIEQWLIRFSQTAEQYGIELYVALPEHGLLEDALVSHGIPVKVIEIAWQPRTLKGSSQYIQELHARANALAAWIQSENIELIHTNTPYLFEGALAAMQSGRPHIWHLRSTYGKDAEPYAFGGLGLSLAMQTKILGWLADGILSVSASTANAFIQNGLDAHINHDGIDVNSYLALSANFPDTNIRKELGLATDTPLVANIARISPEKDIPTYIETCRLIHQTLPTVHFLVIGNQHENAATTTEVRQKIADTGMQRHVHLLGERHDMPALYSQLNLVMLTSRHEGLSNVLKEAMTCGTPVVATRCGGPEVLIEHRHSGLLCDVGDAYGLAEAAIHCLTDRDLARTLADAGTHRITRNFSQDQSLSNLIQYYTSIRDHFDSAEQAKRFAMADMVLTFARHHADLYMRLDAQEKSIHELRNRVEQRPMRAHGLLHWLMKLIRK